MNLPTAFIHNIHRLLGDEEADKLLAALQTGQPTSIRLNNRLDAPASTSEWTPVPWCATGYYLNERLTFTFDPLFHAGRYYVQEAASMFLAQALQQYVDTPVLMLDLCAAPGGKTTLARSVLPKGSLLVANEVMSARSQVLAENVVKQGHPDVVVTNNDPADFAPLKAMFDVILTDVPCSGEGMFRKDEVAIEEWSQENVNICWQRQRRIVADIWPCLKPGGLLIYSTCTYNTQENEENVRWIADELGAEVLPLHTEESWGITGNLLPDADFPVYRFLPHKTQGEGLFLAVLRKAAKEEYADQAGYTPSREEKRGKGKREAKQPAPMGKEAVQTIRTWLTASDDYKLTTVGNRFILLPEAWANEVEALHRAGLRILLEGCPVAEQKGKDLCPLHNLAMSNLLNIEAFPQAEVSYEQAIAYLRKEALILPPHHPRGYLLLTYLQTPLGFVKNIGNRANNLYPQEWRIRSSYLPEAIKLFM